MTDISMKDNRLPMVNGDFVLTKDLDELKQHVSTALNTFYTDWLLDFTKGIDLAYGMRHTEFLEHDVKKQILGVDGVQSIKSFDMTFDRGTLAVKITASLKTTYGHLEFEGILNNEY